MRVLPKVDGTCPSCQVNIQEEAKKVKVNPNEDTAHLSTSNPKPLDFSWATLEKVIKAEKYSERMMRGLIWTIVGIAITTGTYFFAEPGDHFIICWGAVLFGVIDFLVGLFGWLANRQI